MAIVNESDLPDGQDWVVYFINMRPERIQGVLIRSNGFGHRDGLDVRTSELRHFADEIPAESYIVVESIMPEVFDLSNEYHVSYYLENQLYDKRYVFLPDSISEQYTVDLPIVGKRGILIR